MQDPICSFISLVKTGKVWGKIWYFSCLFMFFYFFFFLSVSYYGDPLGIHNRYTHLWRLWCCSSASVVCRGVREPTGRVVRGVPAVSSRQDKSAAGDLGARARRDTRLGRLVAEGRQSVVGCQVFPKPPAATSAAAFHPALSPPFFHPSSVSPFLYARPRQVSFGRLRASSQESDRGIVAFQKGSSGKPRGSLQPPRHGERCSLAS